MYGSGCHMKHHPCFDITIIVCVRGGRVNSLLRGILLHPLRREGEREVRIGEEKGDWSGEEVTEVDMRQDLRERK